MAGTAEFSRVIREYLLEMTFPQSLGGDGGKGLLGRGLCEGLRWEQACLLWPREQGAVRVGEASRRRVREGRRPQAVGRL